MITLFDFIIYLLTRNVLETTYFFTQKLLLVYIFIIAIYGEMEENEI